MRTWTRWLLGLITGAMLLVPMVFASVTTTQTALHLPRSTPPTLTQALERATGLTPAPTSSMRILEHHWEADSVLLLPEPTARVLGELGVHVRFLPLYSTRTAVVTSPSCHAQTLADLAAPTCPVTMARGDSGLSFAAFARALADAMSTEGSIDEVGAATSHIRAIRTVGGTFTFAEPEDMVRDWEGGRGILVLPEEWVPELLRADPTLSVHLSREAETTMGLLAGSGVDVDALTLRLEAEGIRPIAEPGEVDTSLTYSFLQEAQAATNLLTGEGATSTVLDVTLSYGLVALALTLWALSLYWRIAAPNLRMLVLLAVFFLLLWCVLRLLRFTAPVSVEVAVWLLTFVPMIGSVTVAAFISLSLLDERAHRLNRILFPLITAVSALMALLVLTTGFHGLVLKIPADRTALDTLDFGVAYPAFITWLTALGLTAWGLLIYNAGSRRKWVGIVLQLGLLGLIFGFWTNLVVDGHQPPIELNLVAIVMMALIWEIALRTGQIPTSGRYRLAFEHSLVPARLVDPAGHLLAQTAADPSLWDDNDTAGRVHHRIDLKAASLEWLADLSSLEKLRAEVDASHRMLRERLDWLECRGELAVLSRELARRTKVLNALDAVAGPCIERASNHGAALPTAGPAERARLLRLTAVDLAHAKQAGRLLLDALDSSRAPAHLVAEDGWLPRAELLHSMNLILTDFTCATHVAALIPLGQVSSGWVRATDAIDTLEFLHLLLRACAQPDGAEVLVHMSSTSTGHCLRALVETTGENLSLPSWFAPELGTAFPRATVLIDEASAHLRVDFSSVGADGSQGLADTGSGAGDTLQAGEAPC